MESSRNSITMTVAMYQKIHRFAREIWGATIVPFEQRCFFANERTADPTERLMRFSPLMPQHLDVCWMVMHAVFRMNQRNSWPLVSEWDSRQNLCRILAEFRAMLGMPEQEWRTDFAFIGAIDQNPGELANWAAYADFLAEGLSDDPDGRRRGAVIAALLKTE